MLRADAGVQRVQRTPRECKASGTTLGAPLTNPHVSRAAEAAHNPTYSLPHLRLFCCCAVSLTLFLFPGVHPRADKPLRTRQKVPGVTGQVQQLSALSGSGLKFWHCLETWAHQTFTDPTCWEHQGTADPRTTDIPNAKTPKVGPGLYPNEIPSQLPMTNCFLCYPPPILISRHCFCWRVSQQLSHTPLSQQQSHSHLSTLVLW